MMYGRLLSRGTNPQDPEKLSNLFRLLERNPSLPEVLKAAGINQSTLARHLGVNKSTISRLLRNPARWREFHKDPERREQLLRALALALEETVPFNDRVNTLARILHGILDLDPDTAEKLARQIVLYRGTRADLTFMS